WFGDIAVRKNVIRFTWFAVGKVIRNIKFVAVVFVVLFKFKGSLPVQRSFLRATQSNRSSRFAPCAKHSHLAGLAFAGAKAMGLLAQVKSRHPNQAQQSQPAAAGTVKSCAFAIPCARRYAKN